MTDETTPQGDVPAELAAAIEAVKASPDDEAAWDRVEDEAASAQRPDDVAALYEQVLGQGISPELANTLGQRATNFLEEWFGEESDALTRVLSRVLEIDRSCDWAFQRLTVAYTVSGRWDELLGLYDLAIAAADLPSQKQAYLDEAVNIAKDFAQAPDRAIGYLQQLLSLQPSDQRRVGPLERLLEKQERWRDLVELWRSQLEYLQVSEVTDQRLRIATSCLDRLGDAALALEQVEAVIGAGGSGPRTEALLERIAAWDGADREVLRRALALLKARYESTSRPAEVVRVVEADLALADSSELAGRHREVGERLMALDRHAEAMPHFAALLKLEPTAVDAHERLRELAGRTGNGVAFAEALEAAGQASEQVETRVTLLLEAAKTRRMVLNDLEGSISLYFKVLAEAEVAAPIALQACRQLNALLETTGRNEEQLVVLERLAVLEPEASERRDVLGRAARLADTLGETDRSLALWSKRVDEDATDVEALSAMISLLKRESRWEALIDALLKRAKAPVSQRQSREDLVMVARLRAQKLGDLDAAIATWLEIRTDHGEDEESTNALADLYAQTSRWEEYSALLDGAAERESNTIAGILARLGEVCRDQLAQPDRAIQFYRRALRIDPGQTEALQGLRRMLEDLPERRGPIAGILAGSYELTENWDRVLDLVEHRLGEATTAAAQGRLLRETAVIQEQRLGDSAGALRSACRALVLTPWDDSLEAELIRLGDVTGEWVAVVAALNDAAEAAMEATRRLHLRFEAGRLAEERVDDPRAALEAYAAVLGEAPARVDAALAVVRAGAKTARWDRVAGAIVGCAEAKKELPGAVVEAAVEAAAAAGAWTELAEAVEAALEGRDALPPALARQVDRLVASWHEDRRSDPDAAERALRRAVARAGDDEEALRSLVRIQRRAPGRDLYGTLMRLGDICLAKDDLDPIHEAAKLAREALGDGALSKEALQRLYREASRLWRRGAAATGEGSTEVLARFALDNLVDMHVVEEEYERAVNLLVDGATLPLDEGTVRDLRRRAAKLCTESMGDHQRALVVYRTILADSPDDLESMREFAQVCRAVGLDLELLSVLQRELTLCDDADRRLDLRLEIAQLIGRFENLGGRLQVLEANLEERPGHGPSIEALVEVLEGSGRHLDLAGQLTSQAKLLEDRKKTDQAAALWEKVAALAEQKLGDTERAIQALRRVQKLSGSIESLDALARLQSARGEHASAARWLERRLQQSEGPAKLDVSKQLAQAYLANGQTDEAIKRLEATLELSPQARDVRDQLATLYRNKKDLESLARLLTEAAPYIDDLTTLRAYANEAAELYSQMGSPDRAITVLEKAAAHAPDDKSIRRMLAEGLIAATRLDEARTLLESLINDFGRRRNPERAGVHFLLARALKAQGNLEGALEQLELAAKMDVADTRISAMLGHLAREAGQLDRAERTFRALLMVIRRQRPEDVGAMGAAEVLYELYELARAQGNEDQAQELLRSVLQTASGSADEVRRFRRAMLERQQPALLLEALQMRVKAAAAGKELADALADLAEVLATQPERREEALASRLKALEEVPDSWKIHDVTRTLARELEQSKRYAELLRALINASRGEEEAVLASHLLLRLGFVLEEDLKDFDGAAKAYSRVEALGHHVVQARVALARVAGARGDRSEEVRLLKALVADESLSETARGEGRFRLAELLLTTPESSAEGLAILEDAIERDAFYDRAGAILRVATDAVPEGERLELYGKVARATGDDDLLLDYLAKRLKRFDATLDEAREAAQLLEGRPAEGDRHEATLRRAVEIAEMSVEGLGNALWALTGLAARLKAAGNLKQSAEWLSKAAEACPDEAEALDLRLAAAARAAEGGDNALALTVYERLLERDPSNMRILNPALESARALGDEGRVVGLVERALGTLTSPSDRSAVRVHHAAFLERLEGREPDAAAVLRTALQEEPGNDQATQLLTKLYERIGFDENLSEILRAQLDQARDAQDLAQIRDISLRLGEGLQKIRREDAMDVYRQGLAWLPDDRELGQRLLALLGPEDDPRERVDLMERPLKSEQGDAASALALRLADEWAALGDDAGVERVLRLGYEINPADATLRERLEKWFGDRGDWQSLADHLVGEATRLADPAASVTLLRNAALIHRDSLFNPEGALECLAQARVFAPNDLDLLAEVVQQRRAVGDFTTAVAEVTEVLERFELAKSARTDLLLLRADLHGVMGDDNAIVVDLEEAYALTGSALAERLVAGLEQQRLGASSRGDAELERVATLRLVAVHLENGARDPARDTLRQWLSRSPQDRDALYHLLQLDEAEEQWEAVASTCEHLVAVETGEAQVKMVMRLADACDRVGQPANAREGLERVYQAQPQVTEVRDRLWNLYEAIGAKQELATILVSEALANEDQEEKFTQLRRAGGLFLSTGEGGVEKSIAPLEEAVRIKPDDHETTILLIDAYSATGRYAESGKLLEQAIAARGARRTPQLSELQHRMARLAAIAGDKQLQLQWLNVAFDSDRRNGQVVADLAYLAMELGELDLALSALRVVTVSKVDSPLTKGVAFLMQAKIAQQRGEGRRAVMWAHRAIEEDPTLAEAHQLIQELGGA